MQNTPYRQTRTSPSLKAAKVWLESRREMVRERGVKYKKAKDVKYWPFVCRCRLNREQRADQFRGVARDYNCDRRAQVRVTDGRTDRMG